MGYETAGSFGRRHRRTQIGNWRRVRTKARSYENEIGLSLWNLDFVRHAPWLRPSVSRRFQGAGMKMPEIPSLFRLGLRVTALQVVRIPIRRRLGFAVAGNWTRLPCSAGQVKCPEGRGREVRGRTCRVMPGVSGTFFPVLGCQRAGLRGLKRGWRRNMNGKTGPPPSSLTASRGS